MCLHFFEHFVEKGMEWEFEEVNKFLHIALWIKKKCRIELFFSFAKPNQGRNSNSLCQALPGMVI